jgi:biotin carboxyl carrier protein
MWSGPEEGALDLKEIRAVLKLIQETDVEEIEVEQDGRRVRIRRRSHHAAPSALSPVASMPPAPVTRALPSALDARDTTNLITVAESAFERWGDAEVTTGPVLDIRI